MSDHQKKWEGINPEGLTDEALSNMPEGARLLECDKERQAFYAADIYHNDLFIGCRDAGRRDAWKNLCRGAHKDSTYCTTRPLGWWRKTEPKIDPVIAPDRSFDDWWNDVGRDKAERFFWIVWSAAQQKGKG